MGFESFKQYIPESGSLQLTMKMTTDDRMNVMVAYTGNCKQANTAPITMEGAFTDLNKEFFPALQSYQDRTNGFVTNLAQIEKDLKAQEEKAKANEKLTKETDKKIKDNKELLIAPLNIEDINWLVHTPDSDTNFKGAIERASFLSLIEAGKQISKIDGKKSVFNKISSALNKLSGNKLEGYGIEYGTKNVSETPEVKNKEKDDSPAMSLFQS